MSLKFIIFLAACVVCFAPSESARILGLFADPVRSHVIIHTAITDALVERGHDVTVVTNVPVGKKNPNYTHIYLPLKDHSQDQMTQIVNKPKMFLTTIINFSATVMQYANESLNDPAIQKMMDEESFDLVILGYFFNEFHLGVAAHFKCPVVVSYMAQMHRTTNDFVGNPVEVAYVPNMLLGTKQPMNFWARVKNFLVRVLLEEICLPIFNRQQQKLYKANFPPEKYPSFEEMKKNISLILTNHHFSQGPIRPNVPAVVEIGGIQVKEKPDPLPEDLKAILDNSTKHGAIYFSLGSNVQGSHLASAKAKIMFDVLSKLPQTILWKWDDSKYPGQSPNIIYKSWLPQDDILAHPNVRLFITHGGQGSVVESQYHGVPMVGIPFFGDQNSNMASVEKEAFGLKVNYLTLTEEIFRTAIEEVLSNSKYTENIQRFAKLYKDRPMSAKDTAVFWVEYVLRHRGAPHMQSPAVHLNTFQLVSLDVLGLILLVLYLVVKLFRVIFSLVFRRKSGGGKKKRE